MRSTAYDGYSVREISRRWLAAVGKIE